MARALREMGQVTIRLQLENDEDEMDTTKLTIAVMMRTR